MDASSGPGLGQLDTAAAAKEISSSAVTTGGGEGGEADSELLAGGGGAGGADVVVVDTSAVSGGDFVFVSPPAAANGGSGGGAGVSHLVWKIGKKIDWMVMIMIICRRIGCPWCPRRPRLLPSPSSLFDFWFDEICRDPSQLHHTGFV